MALFVYSSQILDRDIESTEIASFIDSNKRGNKILWVCADTGVGKTSLIKKANQKKKSLKKFIEVKTPPSNENNCIIQGQYISYIATAINKSLKDEGGTLKDFILGGIENRISRIELQKVIEGSITKIPQNIITAIVSRYTQTGINDFEQYLLSTDIDSILLLREYIKYSLKVRNIIIYISNMQNIDSRSLTELAGIISETTDTVYLFEFTTHNKCLDNVHKINELFQGNADIAIELLDPLPVNYAVSIMGNPEIGDYKKWEQYYQTIICGNLYKLQNTDINSKNYLSHDPLEKIYDLPLEALVILQIISIHEGEISLIKLDYILNYAQPKFIIYFSNHFDELSPFLEKYAKTVKFIHSSVKDFLQQSTNVNIEKSKLIAYGMLRDIFNKDLGTSNYNWYTKKELVLYLVKIYAQNSPEKIMPILDKFKELIIDDVGIEQINHLLDLLFDELSQISNSRIIIRVIKICYDLGLYSRAYTFLTDNFQNNINYYMYKASLLNRLDRHYECISYCDSIMDESPNIRYKLTIQLIKMLSLRTLNRKNEYRQLYFNLLNSRHYMTCLEYGFLLRNSEILFSPVNDIPYIKRSIKHFEKYNDLKNILYAQLTLATEYAYAGKIKSAETILGSIADDFLQTTTEKHIYYNDLAAVQLAGKTADENTLVSLEQALLYSRNSYDTLTILSNKICWFILCKKKIPNIKTFKKKLNNLIKIEPDLRMCKRIYFNLHQYYKYVEKNTDIALIYWQKAENLREVLDDKLSKMMTSKTKDYLYPQVYVSFITYWHFDIPNL